MNSSVFREYDIRGLAEKDFDKEFALLLGKVHGTIISEKAASGSRWVETAARPLTPMRKPL